MFIRPLWFFFFDYYVGVRSKQKSTKMYDMAGEKKLEQLICSVSLFGSDGWGK
jgi:hypothetical protein